MYMSDPPPNVVNVNVANYAVAGTAPGGGPGKRKSVAIAYLLCLSLGLWGGHRFYLRRRHTLFLVAAAMGGGGVTQPPLQTFILIAWLLRIFADLFVIPRWVREHNAGAVGVALASPAHVVPSQPMVVASAPTVQADADEKEAARPPKDLQTILLEAAHDGDGKLTVTQGVMATGKTFEEVETCLRRMTESGYVDVDNEPNSGVVIYVFPELVGRSRPGPEEAPQA